MIIIFAEKNMRMIADHEVSYVISWYVLSFTEVRMCGDHFDGNLLKKSRKKNVAFLKDREYERNRCVLLESEKYNAPLINTHFTRFHAHKHTRAHIILSYQLIIKYNQMGQNEWYLMKNDVYFKSNRMTVICHMF